MQKTKYFDYVFFSPDAIEEIATKFKNEIPKEHSGKLTCIHSSEMPDAAWDHETDTELFADIHNGANEYKYRLLSSPYDLIISYSNFRTNTVVSSPSRSMIESKSKLCHIERTDDENSILKSNLKVFIGHGRSTKWRELKDHFHDQHQIDVVAYETGSRAGHTIRDILDEMLSECTMAFVIMTAEDEQADGALRARQNVIHEIGLFQGRLGFPRAIVLLEEDAEEFSNIAGIQQIRFSKNNIRETFGDVLATIRREFPHLG